MRWRRTSPKTWATGMKGLGITLSILMFIVWQHVEARHLERQLSAMRKESDQLIFQNVKENQIKV